MNKQITLLIFLIVSSISWVQAQNVGIGTTTPDASAQLDITSTTKGVLVPRMTMTQRNAIASPATGLLIFQTDNTPGFYFWNGTVWENILGSNGTQNWSLTGNTGTNPITQFIGTTDNVPLTFRVNNILSGRIETNSGNTSWGYQSFLSNTSGTMNTAVGYHSLNANTTGTYNSSSGGESLFSNNTGSRNSSFGYRSLYANTDGNDNTSTGYGALRFNTGNFNTANGSLALYGNTTGNNNTAFGYSTLEANTTGANNTSVGMNALKTNTLGNNNTALGYGADVSSGILANATAIGYNAKVNASNTIQIGNPNVTDVYLGDGTTTTLHANFDFPTNQLLIPVVALTGTDDVTTIPSPELSLLVYNTATTIDSGERTAPAGGLGEMKRGRIGPVRGGDDPPPGDDGGGDDGGGDDGGGDDGGGDDGSGTETVSTAVSPGFYYWKDSAWVALLNAESAPATYWSRNGNKGTVDGWDFIGTTDNVPLTFAVNYKMAGRIDGELSYSTYWGYEAGVSDTAGYSNVGIGYHALFLNASGKFNTANGYGALRNNTSGSNNSATGSLALYSNTSGTFNTANGNNALEKNTTGNNNSADGSFSLNLNTTGKDNTANGYSALRDNTTGNYNSANGSLSLRWNNSGDYNTANGYSALRDNTNGNYNSANGSLSLKLNTTGEYNTANGYSALEHNTTGDYNSAIGSLALNSNTTGSLNTAMGYHALTANTTGTYNVSTGVESLHSNTIGNRNSSFGYRTLYANIIGSDNSGVGYGTLRNNTGSFNTSIGSMALYSNTTGNSNTSVGYNALKTNTVGGYNTAIGYGADVSNGGLSNATAIGYNAIVNMPNKVRIGNTGVIVIEGQVPFSFPSDARFKYNIHDNVPGLDFITRLKPVTYYFDGDKLSRYTETGVLSNSYAHNASYTGQPRLQTGFLAQDVEKIAEELGYDFDGIHKPVSDRDHYSLAYSQFIMPLVKAVQEQQVMIKDLESTVERQQNDAAKLFQLIKSLQKEVQQLKEKSSASK